MNRGVTPKTEVGDGRQVLVRNSERAVDRRFSMPYNGPIMAAKRIVQ